MHSRAQTWQLCLWFLAPATTLLPPSRGQVSIPALSTTDVYNANSLYGWLQDPTVPVITLQSKSLRLLRLPGWPELITPLDHPRARLTVRAFAVRDRRFLLPQGTWSLQRTDGWQA